MLIGSILNPLLLILSSVVLIVSISSIILLLDIITTLSISMFLIILYIFLFQIFKKKFQKNSSIISDKSNVLIKTLNEGFGSIRDLHLTGNQNIYLNSFHKADLQVRKANADNIIISSSPRYFVEIIGIVAISTIATLFAVSDNNFISKIPILTGIALGAQKLLPYLNQAFSSVALIKGSTKILEDILNILDLNSENHSIKNNSLLDFKEQIRINSLSYKYLKIKNYVLKNVNLNIFKVDKVGIIGESGSGKSTFQDLLITLLSPSKGHIEVDDVILNKKNKYLWQRKIACVPQNVYLLDASIKENIIFGSKTKFNQDLFNKSIINSRLKKFTDNLQHGYHTNVGENGGKLSGGQIQRIGIARALYKNPEIIFF